MHHRMSRSCIRPAQTDTPFAVGGSIIRSHTALLLISMSLASDKPGIYKVVTSSTHKLSDVLPEGTIYRINTGGPLPAGTDTVIMVEDTRLVSSIKDEDGEDLEEAEVETLVEIPVGENVRAPGSDVRKGDLALQKGQIIHGTGGEIGTLVFVGRKEVYTCLAHLITHLLTS